jgi:hypothetical protein
MIARGKLVLLHVHPRFAEFLERDLAQLEIAFGAQLAYVHMSQNGPITVGCGEAHLEIIVSVE